MDTKDIITLILATYGAGLSTYVAVAQRRDKRARVRATISYGFLTGGPEGLSDQQVIIKAANIGEKSITISSGGLQLPNGRTATNMGNNSEYSIPHQLEPGTSMAMWFPLGPLANQLSSHGCTGKVKVRAKFTDQTSREYLSKPIEIDLAQWSK